MTEPTPGGRDALAVGSVLAFVAGFSDASTFVGAGGVFCAHVTGNFVVLAADVATGAGADDWVKLATFPIFVIAVLGATWLHRRRAAPVSRETVRFLLGVKSALFAAAAVVAVATPADDRELARIAIVALLVTAMGTQNALHRIQPALGPMTTVMTGNVTQWLTETMQPSPSTAPDKRRLLGAIILSFAIGCAFGAFGVVRFGFVVMLAPMAVLLAVRARL